MGKDTYFFTHDYNARNDLKLAALREDYGMEGVGIYWCLVEMLYEEGGYINLSQVDNITKVLRTNTTVLRNIIDSILFKNDGERLWSESVLRRLEQRQKRSELARQSVLKRYERTTNVHERIPSNTIKGKERILNNKEIYKEKYGELSNVLLTTEEYQKLKDRFNGETEERINRLSTYIASKGDKYKSHYATLLSWSQKDKITPVKKVDDGWDF
jgi:hypothetical protein